MALPRDGIGAIAQQLATALPVGTIRLGAPVNHIEGASIVLESGERLAGDALVSPPIMRPRPDCEVSARHLVRHESRHACILMRLLLRYAVPG